MITVATLEGDNPNNDDKEVVFKNCVRFTNCICEINNAQIDNGKHIDVIMQMYNLIQYSNNYSKTLGSLWQYYRDEPALTDAGAITNFHVSNNNSASFKLVQKKTSKTAANGRQDAEIAGLLKYLSNFWRALEMSLIHYKINLILTWSYKCILSSDTKEATLAIADIKRYVPIVTLSTQDNTKLFQQLKSCFKKTINFNKYQPKVTTQAPKPYLDFLIETIFKRINRLFVSSFENKDDRTGHTKCYLPTVETNDYNAMIDGRNLFGQTVKNNLITYDNIRKIVIGQGDDYTTGCRLDYNYFNKYYKTIATDLSKQQALDANPEGIQQINFTGNLDRG